ncbi:uncharacterized protein M421DRAFT_417144 [Didymella exigua CBS 183.55]|uniref:Uncharacterized protein n=1 Tax=Didymella exigua CBS 183.55 TaxID=1150837 RepID=A0A6A5RYW7_9PLEO|nr:uncharacterized protein M421DRAFT_417144 [Didymella exigua CBS 183.55]KAF1932424.1 hypothetical protein M421DRAFT_417144 [Didymella exigua CBS 183.55]
MTSTSNNGSPFHSFRHAKCPPSWLSCFSIALPPGSTALPSRCLYQTFMMNPQLSHSLVKGVEYDKARRVDRPTLDPLTRG